MFSDIFTLVYLCTGEKKMKPGMILVIWHRRDTQEVY